MIYRPLALAAVLGVLPACLNPDISDEYPLTMRADALELDDAGAEGDEPADEARVDESGPDDRTPASGAPDVAASDSENRTRPRRGFARR